MKIVITGFDARAASQTTSLRHFSMGAMLRYAFEVRGHEVHQHGCWALGGECADIIRDADVVLVGLGSPVALSSHYSNAALSTLYRLWRDNGPIRLFLDDPDVTKWRHGALSAARRWQDEDHDALYGNASFLTRKHHADALDERTKMYVATGMLGHLNNSADGPHDPILIPLHGWATRGEDRNHIGVDFTRIAAAMLEEHFEDIPSTPPQRSARASAWYIEKMRADAWAKKTSLALPSTVGSARGVEDRVSQFGHVYGVLESAPSLQTPGWWTPTMTIASVLGTPYFTDLGLSAYETHVRNSPLYVLPTTVERYDDRAYEMHVKEQQVFSTEFSDTVDDIIEKVMDA